VHAVPVEGYWRDLGQPHTYLQGHRDLLAGRIDVFDHPHRPIVSHWPDRTAARVRPSARLTDSLLSPGCDVAGEVSGSVLGPGAVVERGPGSPTA
jgi:glucose-1-phosphate adenylyltransferase